MNAEEIFHDVLARPQAERPAFLAAACAADQALQQRVEALLRAHENPGSFLAEPPPLPAATQDEPAGERPGSVVGPYKLVEEIGEGGMGTVWLAQQTEPVKRLVALKVIKPGMDSRQVIARFEAERQALAIMDHPNIAKVHDGGATPSGRPYFVMELVKGVPLTKYCDEHRLTPRERLELFIPVCQAIQHAHQKGIIHRDIKPSNVLVALYDGKPVPKVIDFGVAKATGQQLTEHTLVTGFGAVVGTLEYMSPEQAELNQLDIDTRSDIYSLGVLLYELLTGTTPLDKKRLKEAALLEVLRAIREEEPPRPSTRLSTTDELPSVAANRAMEPRKLSGLVRGELDWIVMKCLEKDRGRRYETASGLAQDIQRYLADEPVQAGPPSAWYRFRKFARRHKGRLAVAGLLSMALVTVIAVLAVSNVRINQEIDEKDKAFQEASDNEKTAREQEQKAKHNLRKAMRTVDQLLTRVAADRLAGLPHMEPLKQALLEDALTFYLGFLEENRSDPAVALETGLAYNRAGAIQDQLGQYDKAKQSYQRGIALFEELAAKFPDVPRYRRELARGNHLKGLLLQHIGLPGDAEKAYRRAQGLLEQLVAEKSKEPAADRENLARSHGQLGNVFQMVGRLPEAETAFRRALALSEQLAADFPKNTDHRNGVAGSYLSMGVILGETNRFVDAEKYLRKNLEIRQQIASELPGQRDYDTKVADAHRALATLLMDVGRFEEAEQESRKALELLQKLVDDFPSRPDYRHELGEAHANLGGMYAQAGRLEEAEESLKQDCKLHEKLAADYPSVAVYQSNYGGALSNYGFLLQRQRKRQEARTLWEEAIRRQQAAVKLSPKTVRYRNFLGNHYVNLAAILHELDAPEAEKAHQQALAFANQLAADFPNEPQYQALVASALNNLSTLLRAQDKLDKARQLLEEALDRQQTAVKANPRSPVYLKGLERYYSNLAIVMDRMSRPAEAEDAVRQQVAVLQKLTEVQPGAAADQSKCGAILHNLAVKHHARKELEPAIGLLEQAIRHQQAAVKSNPNNPTYLGNLSLHYRVLNNVLRPMGRLDRVEETYRLSISVLEKLIALCPEDPAHQSHLAAELNDLAQVLLKRDPGQGRELLEKAIVHQEVALRQKPGDATCRRFLGHHYLNLGQALVELKRYPEAEKAYRLCLEIRGKLAAEYPAEAAYQADARWVEGRLADLAARMRKKEEQ
jgi:serine/threonine protein kinase